MEGLGSASTWAIFMAVLMLALSSFVLKLYARKDVHWSTVLSVIICWNVSLSVTYLLPIDIYFSNTDSVHREFFASSGIWPSIYWIAFVMTWVGFPIQQGYAVSGYISPLSRMVDSLKSNLIFYAVCGVLGLLGIMWIAVVDKLEIGDILLVLSGLGNVWGYSLYVLLLGYGLIEVPRMLWNHSVHQTNYRSLFYDAQKSHTDYEEALDNVIECYHAALIIRKRTNNDGGSEIIQRYLNLFDSKWPTQLEQYNRAPRELTRFLENLDHGVIIDEKLMASIHAKLKSNLLQMRRSWHHFDRAYDALDVLYQDDDVELEDYLIVANDFSKQNLSKRIFQAISFICILLSAVILWSEITMFIPVNLSPFASMMHASLHDFSAVQVLGLIVIFYLCACSFFSLFQLHLSKFYRCTPDRHTEDFSLLFNGSLLIRQIFPLGLNFLHMLRINNTSYTDALKGMEVISGGRISVNKLFFPLLLFIVSAVTYFNLFGKLLQLLRISSFDPQQSDGADIVIAEGKSLIKRERRIRRSTRRKSANP